MQFSHPAHETMFRAYNSQVEFREADWQLFAAGLEVINVDARDCLLAIGQPAQYHYFIVSGLVRWYYITPEGKELNKGFYGEGFTTGNLSAVILNEPSRFAIETLEPCQLVRISVDYLKSIKGQCQSWDDLWNYSCQMHMVRNERREAELLTLSPADRYRSFVKNFAAYLDRIPQYHIASYLGINPVSLSKFKQQWLQANSQ